MPQSFFQRGMTSEFAARYLLVDVSDIAETARQKHNLKTRAGLLMAEALAASALMASQIKGKERLTIQIQAERPKFSFICDINADGGVRSRLAPSTTPHPKDRAIKGLMLAIKHNEQKELYRGITPIDHQPVDRALQIHLQQSSQVDVIIRIVVQQQENGHISRAIGILVERLPPAKDLPALNTEQFEQRYQAVFDLKIEEFIQQIDEKKLLGQELYDMETRMLSWQCKCSEEQIRAMLFSLGPQEIELIIAEQGEAKVNCHFCNTDYIITKPELQKMLLQHERNYN